MKLELTAILEAPDGPENPFWTATCPEVPGANGQGETEEACIANLLEAVQLMNEYRRDEGLEHAPPGATTRKLQTA